MIGRKFGAYEITEKLGSGGMGSVYRCVDSMLDREAAVKMLHPELARQAQVVERFRAEAKVLAKLNHPNIATVFGLFEDGDDLLMVLEYVPGRTLEQILEQDGPLPVARACELLAAALDGVEHAHCLDIVHRDLKPANLILGDGDSLKVMDFGIARIVGSDRMTRQGHVVGTIEYMSPEQVKQGEADARSDVYSMGIVLFEMLTGSMPFHADSDFDLMKAQLEAPPPAPRELAPHVPEEVEAVVLKALAKKPEDRYQTAAEMRLALIAAAEAGLRGSPGARQTRLAGAAPAATRLGTPAAAEPAAGAAAAEALQERLAGLLDRLIGQAKRLSWQYWVIGASVVVALGGILLWAAWQNGAADVEAARRSGSAAASSPERGAAETTAPTAQRSDPIRIEPQPPDGGAPAVPVPPTTSPPSALPPSTSPPQPAPEVEVRQPESAFQTFARNFDQLDRLMDDLKAGGNSFQDDYRAWLKQSRKWKPVGAHRTAWDQIDDFGKAVARMRRDLTEVGDDYDLVGGGRASRWLRKAKQGARDLSERVAGNQADADLGRLRTQAGELDNRAERIGTSLRTAGASGSLQASWSRLRTEARRVRQLLAAPAY